MLRFPRMLFLHGADDVCCVVASEDEMAAKVAEGYQARPLPGEPGYGEAAAPVDGVVRVSALPSLSETVTADAPPVRKKPGPKPKE
jgi:hypothetical protein